MGPPFSFPFSSPVLPPPRLCAEDVLVCCELECVSPDRFGGWQTDFLFSGGASCAAATTMWFRKTERYPFFSSLPKLDPA